MPEPSDRFATLSGDDAESYFATAPALEVAGLIEATADDELRRLLALPHVRDVAIRALLARFADFADPGRLPTVTGVVRFELRRGRGDVERHTLHFSGGVVTREPGDDARPDVTISLDPVAYLRLVSGQANAALLYLGAELGVDGDEMLALDVGTVFSVPGSEHAGVDPTALDPVDVATAVARTPVKHLRTVMGGGFRPVVLTEVFRRFPDFIDVGKAERMRLSVGFRIGGRADGGVDRYAVHVADGACTVETAPPEGQGRDATISCDGADFLRLATGQLHPVRGVLTGTLKVKGDRAKALAFNGAMRPPQPRKT